MPSTPLKLPTDRLQALDVFRGFTLAAMIFVNFPGSSKVIWRQLRHGEWSEFTFADLVFPFFLFIIGVSLTLSSQKASLRGIPPRAQWRKAIQRGLSLYLLGFVISSLAARSFIFSFGTLQRIGIAYLLAFPFSRLSTRGILAAIGAIFAVYLCLMCAVRAPSVPWEMRWVQGATFAEFVDLQILAQKKAIVFSFFGAIVSILFGVICGRTILEHRDHKLLLRQLIFSGLGALACALILSVPGSEEHFWFIPLFAKLWTPTLITLAAGFAWLLLAALIYVIDDLKFTRCFFPFLVLGLNPLAVYALTDFLDAVILEGFTDVSLRKSLYYYFAAKVGEVGASYGIAAAMLAVALLVGGVLYHRGVVVRL